MIKRPDHILLLAGTFEARQLASHLARDFPGLRLTVSFAGAVRNLPDIGLPTRVGGFGGVEGLADFLRQENVTLIVDATHPFAAQMSRNVAQAAQALSLPLIRLERPSWQPHKDDLWQRTGSMEEAVDAIPPGARAFLAIGRKDIQRFYRRADIVGLARMIEPPASPLPEHWKLMLARPPQSVTEEIELFGAHDITHLVTKNSGGARSYAKIEAARQLGLPVIMVDRPTLPKVITLKSTQELVDEFYRRFCS